MRENAFNKLGEDRRFERRDETVFVAFHQHIRMQASPSPVASVPINEASNA